MQKIEKIWKKYKQLRKKNRNKKDNEMKWAISEEECHHQWVKPTALCKKALLQKLKSKRNLTKI